MPEPRADFTRFNMKKSRNLVKSHLTHTGLIRKVLGINANVIRIWITSKLFGWKLVNIMHESFDDSVHAVHDAAIRRQDQRKAQIRFVNQFGVFSDTSAGGNCSMPIPARLIEFPDRGKRYMKNRQFLSKFNQSVHVPSAKTVWAIPKVILLSHSQPAFPRVSATAAAYSTFARHNP